MTTPVPAEQADILCTDLVRIYRSRDVEVQALQGLNLRVDPGEMVALVGASGSGKSTLLGILSGLDEPSAGRAVVAGQDLTGLSTRQRTDFHRHRVGFVWQQTARNLLPFLTAAQNVAVVLAVGGRLRGAARARRVDEVLALVDGSELADQLPSRMDGGEQQRIALAVAVAADPAVLLADEPTGALDETAARQVLATMRRVNEESGVTTLIVTHDAGVADHVRRTVRIRDGRTSTETVRRTDPAAHDETGVAEEFAVIDRVGRLQLPEAFQETLGLRDRVRLTLETDHVRIRPGHGDPDNSTGRQPEEDGDDR